MKDTGRILVVARLLRKYSDDLSWLDTPTLIRLLEKEGHPCQVRTLREDIKVLQALGYEIGVRERERSTKYAWLDHDMSAPELRLLNDAVSSAQFIPKERSTDLINRLAELAGPSYTGSIVPRILVSERIKAKNTDMIYTVQKIQEAVLKDCKISFRYLTYTPEKKQVPKHQGDIREMYVVSPYATVWCNDRYYMVAWSDRRQKIIQYRIDRMKLPKLLQKRRDPPPEGFDLRKYTDQVFWMYSGEEENVTLRCRMSILDQVIDRFGEGIDIKVLCDALFEITVPVSVSGTFFAWVFQFTGEMKITGPEWVVEKYENMLDEALTALQG